MKTTSILPLIGITLATSGCMTNPYQQPTPEQRAQALQIQQAMISRLRNTGYANPQQTAPQNKGYELVKISEEQLVAQMNNLQKGNLSTDSVKRERDGMLINEQLYLDPEGEIVAFSNNPITGNIVYAIDIGGNETLFKYMNTRNIGKTIILGKKYTNGSSKYFESVTGKKIKGDFIRPTAKGVVALRYTSAFVYTPGEKLKSIMAKKGYHIAPFQRGNIGSTGFVLLERNPIEKSNNIGSFMSTLKGLGSTLGMSEVNDYALVNTDGKNYIPLDVSIAGKKVALYSQCHKQNDYLNKCGHVDFKTSLYKPDGSKNLSHYFWKISWYNTPKGAFAVVGEGGLRKVNIINLTARNKATIFERTLGINGFTSYQHPDSTIEVRAQLGFTEEHIPDAVSAYDKATKQPITEEKTK